jgi:hypothetical protein
MLCVSLRLHVIWSLEILNIKKQKKCSTLMRVDTAARITVDPVGIVEEPAVMMHAIAVRI